MSSNIRDLVLDIFSEGADRFHRSCFDISEGTFKFFGGGDWSDYKSIFEGSRIKLEHYISCDGIEQISVYSHGVLVYKDDSYDIGECLKIITYEGGIWENRLKELYDRLSEEQLSLELV